MKKSILILSFFSLLVISDIFSQNTIQQDVKKALNNHVFYNGSSQKSTEKHTIYIYTFNDNLKTAITFTGNEYDNCHACATKMSFFVIKKTNNKWQITKKYYDFTEAGSYGTPPSKQNVKVFKTNKQFMIIIDDSYGNQGYMESMISCYYPLNNKYQNIGNIQTSYDDSGAYYEEEEFSSESWQGKYTFVNVQKDKIPDISLKITGNKNNKQYTKEEYYIFNGKEYVLSKK